MIQVNSKMFIKIIWSLMTMYYKKGYGWECPTGYQCVKGKNSYVWTGQLTTMAEAKKYCHERGLSLLKSLNIVLLREEILKPNITKVFHENVSVWLAAEFHNDSRNYRWVDNNEPVNLGIRKVAGHCALGTKMLRRIISDDCNDKNYVVCMTTKNDWFGKKKRFKCNCRSEQCSFNGRCPFFEGRCALGWFGRGCQLRAALTNVQNKLLDFDGDTCQTNLTSPAYFQLQPASYFWWIRLVSRDKVDKNTFQMELKSSHQNVTCDEPKVFSVSKNTIDLSCCTNLALVTQVMIKWHGQVTLCSAHIYKGQNVALNELSIITSGNMNFAAHYLVNGKRGIIVSSASSSDQKFFQTWTLQLSIRRIIFEVVIYITHPLVDTMMDVNITLELQSVFDSPVRRKNADVYRFTEGMYMLSILSGTQERIKFVKLHFSRPMSSNQYLDVSEIEVYGACVTPYNSFYCNMWCISMTSNNFCHYDGSCDEGTANSTEATSSTAMIWSTGTLATSTRPSVGRTEADDSFQTTAKKPTKCPQGFIGKRCQHLCHCQNGLCFKDGRCQERSSCEAGWFALACQYSDLAKDSDVNDPLLTDNDDSTCYTPSENVISANLSEAFLYTWVRVVFSRNAKVSNFSISFEDTDMCEELRAVAEEKNQFDIFCDNDVVTKHVQITWLGSGSLCSLYINGGRNVAIEDDISGTKDDAALIKISLKDGTTSDPACLSFPSDGINRLTFRYLDPQMVIRIIIYTDRIEGEDNGVFLEGSFDNGSTVFYYKATDGMRHLLYVSETKLSTAANITFRVIEGSINICEIEIYGDCAPPYYNLDCMETCILTCYQHRCNYNGICYNCRHGRHGTHCMEGVITNRTIKLFDKQMKPKVAAQVSVYVYLVIPIIGFCAFSYNVLDLFQRELTSDLEKEQISEKSKAYDEQKSPGVENFKKPAEHRVIEEELTVRDSNSV